MEQKWNDFVIIRIDLRDENQILLTKTVSNDEALWKWHYSLEFCFNLQAQGIFTLKIKKKLTRNDTKLLKKNYFIFLLKKLKLNKKIKKIII